MSFETKILDEHGNPVNPPKDVMEALSRTGVADGIHVRLDQSREHGAFFRLDVESILAAGTAAVREIAVNFNEHTPGSAQLKMDKGKPVAFFSVEVAEYIYGSAPETMAGLASDLKAGRDIPVHDLTLSDRYLMNSAMHDAGLDVESYGAVSFGHYDRIVSGEKDTDLASEVERINAERLETYDDTPEPDMDISSGPSGP